ncbi:hypothetical protein ACOMHN_047663 [Nucella lapillus]
MVFNSTGPEDTRLVQVVTAVYLAAMATMGVIGNVLVLAAVARMSQMHHMTYILVSNLSAVGLLSCVLTIPVHIIHLLTGGGLWEGRNQMACKAFAHVNFGLVLCMLINSAAIALCRYRTVTARHGTRHQSMPTVRIVRLLLFLWALPTLVTLSASPFLGFNALLWDCFFVDADSAFWYMNMMLAMPAVFSTLCMFTAYILIIKKVRDSRLKISNLCHKPASFTDNAVPENKEEKNESEHRKNGDVQNLNLVGVPGPNGLGAIRIFTTMIPDESLNTPSTEVVTPSPGFDFDRSDRREDTGRPGAGSSQGPVCLLQPPLLTPSSDTRGGAASNTIKGKDTLSVPSRSASSFSQDVVSSSSSRDDSFVSGSHCSVTQHDRDSSGRRRFRKEVKLSVHLFLAFFLFCLLYLPLCFLHVLHAVHGVGREGWLVLYTLALSFTSNAWLVYALLNRDFRRAFRALLLGRRSF